MNYIRFSGAMQPSNALPFIPPPKPVPTAPSRWQKLLRWWMDGK